MRKRTHRFPRLRAVVEELGFIPLAFRLTVNEAAFISGVGHEEIRQQIKEGRLKPVYSTVARIIPEGKKPPVPRPMIPYGQLLALQNQENERITSEKAMRSEKVLRLFESTKHVAERVATGLPAH